MHEQFAIFLVGGVLSIHYKNSLRPRNGSRRKRNFYETKLKSFKFHLIFFSGMNFNWIKNNQENWSICELFEKMFPQWENVIFFSFAIAIYLAEIIKKKLKEYLYSLEKMLLIITQLPLLLQIQLVGENEKSLFSLQMFFEQQKKFPQFFLNCSFLSDCSIFSPWLSCNFCHLLNFRTV